MIENAVHNNITLPCTMLSYLPLTIFFIMVAYPGHILKVLKGLKLNLVHTLMLMRGSTEHMNHNASYILLESSLLIYFHKRLFSLSCLGVHVMLDYKFCLL